MLRRQLIPFIFTLLAGCLCGGSAPRLHLVVILLAKPFLAITMAALLFFVVQRSPDIYRLLLFGSSSWLAWDRAFLPPPPRRLLRRIDLQFDIRESPSLHPRFQRPPPALAQ